MGIEKRTCCQIKCTPLETISSYLSVLFFFRGSFSQTLPLSWKSFLIWLKAHLGSSVSKKRWHQRVPLVLFFNLCVYGFINVACVVFRAILCVWVVNICVCFFFCIAAVASIDINLFFNITYKTGSDYIPSLKYLFYPWPALGEPRYICCVFNVYVHCLVATCLHSS